MLSIENIVEKINQSNYSIRPFHLADMLQKNIQELEKCKEELDLLSKDYGREVDFTKIREVIDFVNQTLFERKVIEGTIITHSLLEQLYEESKEVILKKLIQYRKLEDRHKKITGFIKNVIDPTFNKNDRVSVEAFIKQEYFDGITFSPTAKVNATGGISLSNPTLPFSTEDNRKILNWNFAIHCKSTEEIINILHKYERLIDKTSSQQEKYIVSGTTLYADMLKEKRDIWDMDVDSAFLELIEEFKHDFEFRFNN